MCHCLGPYTDEDPETEVVRPRNVQLIPGYYAAILVHRRCVTAKQAYEDIVGAIQARGELEICQDIITWLKAACTARGGMGAQNNIPVVYHPLTPVHLPAEVYAYLTSKVRGDLLALMAPDTAAAELTGTLAGALRALTREGAGGTIEERQEREKQKPYRRSTRKPTGRCSAIVTWGHRATLHRCGVDSQIARRANSTRCLFKSSSGCAGREDWQPNYTTPWSQHR
jgi:hypothetical protein